MSNTLVAAILALICFGQVLALVRGAVPASLYYLCVAPLGYFSVWQFGTWGPDRLCGLLLIVGGLLRTRRDPAAPRLLSHPIALLSLYLVVATVVGAFFWPTEAMAGRSVVYGTLRGLVQVGNWIILLGAAWNIALALREPRAFSRAKRVLIFAGVLHSSYAIYQTVAFASGLPATGIRRPYSEVDAESGDEQRAAFAVGGVSVARPGSLVGEPKGLGAISLVWMAAMITIVIEGRMNGKIVAAFVLSLITLFLTFSTSAWGGFVVMIVAALWTARRRLELRAFRVLVTLLLLSVVGLAVVKKSGLVPEVDGGISSLIRERTTGRVGYLADLAEVQAQEVLAENPALLLFGTGLGGMSFYIADRMGGLDIILFPNTGILAYLCDMGIVGIALLLWALRRGLRLCLFASPGIDGTAVALSFIGVACLMQSFIFDAGIRAFAIAFLLAAEFRQCHASGSHRV